MRRAFRYLPFPENASQAEIIAHKADGPDVYDWEFRRDIFDDLPEHLAIQIADKYIEIYQAEGRQKANLSMLDVKEDLNGQSLKLSASDDEVVTFAKWLASECAYRCSQHSTPKDALQAVTAYVKRRHNIDLTSEIALFKKLNPVTVTGLEAANFPVTVTGTELAIAPVTVTVPVTNVTKKHKRSFVNERNVTLSLLSRLCDEHFWRRTLRNVTIRNVEKHSINLGLVHRHAGTYVSDESFERRRQQKRRNRRALESTYMENEEGDEFSLFELAKTSLANPENRRNELMVRMRGFENISKKYKHQGMFYTITCPSRMHARHSKSGTANLKYDGTTPKVSQKYLVTMWSQIRAKLQRLGIQVYGFRVAEPHHDGTPHWHLLLFVERDQANQLTAVLREYAMRESPDEKGAAKRRFKVVKIDPKRGATGYLSKYISKSIDGFGIDEDLYGNDAKSAAERVCTWASVWGIRQFQQIGGPPVSVYRELRRIKGDNLSGTLKAAHIAADNKKWDELTEIMGGPFAKRKDHSIKIYRLWSDELNRYQEPKGYKITGVEAGNVTVLTRLHKWTLKTDKKANVEQKEQWKPIPIIKSLDSPDFDQGIFEKIRGLEL